MPALNPYLNFNGNCMEAFEHYKGVFGGDFAFVMRFSDVPPEMNMDPAEANKVMHVSLPVGGSILMGSDSPEQYGSVNFGNNVHISVGADSEAEADRIFAGLSGGGDVVMPMEKAFWGDYFGMCTDKFGVKWMISYAYGPGK